MLFFFVPNSLACGPVCDCGCKNYLQHHAGHSAAGVHVCCYRSAAVQGEALCCRKCMKIITNYHPDSNKCPM